MGLAGWLILVLVPIILIVLTAYLLQAYRAADIFIVLLISLIIAGAVSNLIDRLKFGYVIDYIDVSWFTVFNLADSAITIGALLLAISFWRMERQRGNTLTKTCL